MVLSTTVPPGPLSRYFMSQICCEIEPTLAMAEHPSHRADADAAPRRFRISGKPMIQKERLALRPAGSRITFRLCFHRSNPAAHHCQVLAGLDQRGLIPVFHTWASVSFPPL